MTASSIAQTATYHLIKVLKSHPVNIVAKRGACYAAVAKTYLKQSYLVAIPLSELKTMDSVGSHVKNQCFLQHHGKSYNVTEFREFPMPGARPSAMLSVEKRLCVSI